LKSLTKSNDAIKKVLYIATGIPILVTALLIFRYGVNVPTFDQWELISYLQKMDSNSLGFSDVFAQHNEHRIFFPRLIMLALAEVTSWNIKIEMIISLIIQVTSFVLIWKAVARTFEGRKAQVVTLLASICMFNPMQWENWLWGWQIQWYTTILGMIVALYFCAYRPLKRRYANHVLSVGGAVFATFSLAGGMAVWPLLLAMLAIRRQTKSFLVYSSAFAVSLIAYANNYHSVMGHTPLRAMFTHQLEFFRYVTLYLGGAFTNDDQLAPILGAFSIAVFLVLSIKVILNRQEKFYFWIGTASFVLINAIITGSGRFLLGPEQALASRYTSFSLIWLLSLIVMTAPFVATAISKKTAWLQPIVIAGLVVLSSIFTINSIGGIASAKNKNVHDMQASACLKASATPNSDCFRLVYPSSLESDSRNTRYLNFLKDENLSGF
jgi:hypothetical protein